MAGKRSGYMLRVRGGMVNRRVAVGNDEQSSGQFLLSNSNDGLEHPVGRSLTVLFRQWHSVFNLTKTARQPRLMAISTIMQPRFGSG